MTARTRPEQLDVLPIDDRVLDAWALVPISEYHWRTALGTNGDAAQRHHGVTAEAILAAFETQGLDAARYGVLCHDTWAAYDELDSIDAHGVTAGRHVPAGERWAVRADECLMLEAALQRRTLARFAAHLLQVARGQP
jgi:hypothetical protein